MLIKKVTEGSGIPDNAVLDAYSTSQTDAYSCNYVNELIEEGTWKYAENVESRNKFNMHDLIIKNQAQVSYNGNSFTVSGSQAWAYCEHIITLPAGTYKISGTVIGNINYIELYKNGDWYAGASLPYTLTLDSSTTLKLRFYGTTGDITTGSSTFSNIQLESGNIVTTYQNYFNIREANIKAIPESGSNANGNWIKYADGTMICTKLVSGTTNIENAWGNMFESTAISLGSFPQEFIDMPILSVINQTEANQGYFIENVYGVTGSSCGNAYLARPNSRTNQTYRLAITATGRWK